MLKKNHFVNQTDIQHSPTPLPLLEDIPTILLERMDTTDLAQRASKDSDDFRGAEINEINEDINETPNTSEHSLKKNGV